MSKTGIESIFTENLYLGMVTRSDARISSMTAKTENSINPGDFVKISSNGETVEKATANSDILYGVATIGIVGKITPIVTSGHVIAKGNDGVLTGKNAGESVNDSNCLILVNKVEARDETGSKTDGFEVKV